MRCKACPKILTEKDFIVDERGELCYTCMGKSLSSISEDIERYPVEFDFNDDDEDE